MSVLNDNELPTDAMVVAALEKLDAAVHREQAKGRPGTLCVHDQIFQTCPECTHSMFRALAALLYARKGIKEPLARLRTAAQGGQDDGK